MSKKVKKVKKPFEVVYWASIASKYFATREEAEVYCVSRGGSRDAEHNNEFIFNDTTRATILSAE